LFSLDAALQTERIQASKQTKELGRVRAPGHVLVRRDTTRPWVRGCRQGSEECTGVSTPTPKYTIAWWARPCRLPACL
jgi:hypothetical protein